MKKAEAREKMKKEKGKKDTKSKGRITKDMTLGEVIMKYPGAAEIMMKHSFHCIGCHVAAYETIEQGAAVHGFDKKKLKELLEELNGCIR